MSKCVTSLAVVLGVCQAGAARCDGQDKMPAAAQKSADAVKAHLEGLKGGYAQLLFKGEATLKKILPEYQFIVARYRQFPVARRVPEGLAASNLFAVAIKDQKVQHVKDVKGLERFFKEHQVAAPDEATARASLASWLALAQEFRQDGFYKFEVIPREFGCESNESTRTVSGRALVTQGGKGEFRATLTYVGGKLAKVGQTAKIMPGPRPICQATKLLDRDPIVRKMAEQDLLFMGFPAHDYLMEQRAKAAPELQRAIDRLWRRIQANGW